MVIASSTRRSWVWRCVRGGVSLGLLTALVLHFVLSDVPAAELQDSPFELKAAFLYNFAKFTEWPDYALASDTSTFLICVSGEVEHAAAAERLLRDKQVQGHPVVARVVTTVDDAKPCRVLFVEAGAGHLSNRTWRLMTAFPILTVGEAQGFLGDGGIIHLVLEEGRLRFEISPQAAARAQLKISSKLLKLGRIVETP
ncbi:MAG: YfiR family protein [Nitrospiraceae bacterium]